MIQIDNPIHRQVAIVVDAIVKFTYNAGCRLGLWKINKADLCRIIPQKILVIEEEPIGDVIMATPFFNGLRKRYPRAGITVMIGRWAKDVINNNPYINEIIVQDCPWAFSDLLISPKTVFDHLKYFFTYPKLLNKLKSEKFDLAVDLRGDFRNIFLFILLPKIKYSLSYGRTGGEYFLSQSALFKKSEHEIEKNLTLLKYLGVDAAGVKIEVFPSEKDCRKIKDILQSCDIKEGDFICVIHPGSRRQVRLWPLGRYALIGKFVKGKYNAKVILTGSRQDLPLVEQIRKDMQGEGINLVGKLTLLELAALLKRANLLICPDTSVMHLAAAFNTSTVALFGPGEPSQTGPLHKNVYVIDKQFPCRPCLQKSCKLAKRDYNYSVCMDAVSYEDVKIGIINLIG